MPTTYNRGNGHHDHGAKGVRDWALPVVPQQPEVERYVVQVDGRGRDQSRDVKTTRHAHETRQDEQAQRGGGQIGRLIEKAGDARSGTGWAAGEEPDADPVGALTSGLVHPERLLDQVLGEPAGRPGSAQRRARQRQLMGEIHAHPEFLLVPGKRGSLR